MKMKGIIKRLSVVAMTSFFVLTAASLSTFGQTIVGYDTSTQPGGANNFGASPLAPVITDPNVTASGLTRGAGVVTTGASGAARGFGGIGFNTADAAASIAADKFFTFTVQPNAGFELDLSSINPFSYRRSGTGPPNALIQYQIGAGAFADITTVALTSSAASGATVGPIDLTGIAALQNLRPPSVVTFRIVPYGASGPTGTFYIFDVAVSVAPDLALTGTTAAIPTASFAAISGKVVLPAFFPGRVMVTLTDMQGVSKTALVGKTGYYRFRDVAAGETYILKVSAKGATYAPQIITVTEDMTEVNFAPVD